MLHNRLLSIEDETKISSFRWNNKISVIRFDVRLVTFKVRRVGRWLPSVRFGLFRLVAK